MDPVIVIERIMCAKIMGIAVVTQSIYKGLAIRLFGSANEKKVTSGFEMTFFLKFIRLNLLNAQFLINHRNQDINFFLHSFQLLVSHRTLDFQNIGLKLIAFFGKFILLFR